MYRLLSTRGSASPHVATRAYNRLVCRAPVAPFVSAPRRQLATAKPPILKPRKYGGIGGSGGSGGSGGGDLLAPPLASDTVSDSPPASNVPPLSPPPQPQPPSSVLPSQPLPWAGADQTIVRTPSSAGNATRPAAAPYLQRQRPPQLQPQPQPQPQRSQRAAPAEPNVRYADDVHTATNMDIATDTAVTPVIDSASLPTADSRSDIASPPPGPSESAYQFVKRTLSEYTVGTKQLYYNYREVRALRTRAEEAVGTGAADPLTRRQHILMHQTASDMLKSVSVAAFMLPVVGNTVPIIAHMFPRILPSTFHSVATKLGFMKYDSIRSFLYYTEALKSLSATITFYRIRFARPELIEIFRHMTRLEEAITAAKNGREYTNADLIALAPIFQFFFPTVEALDHSNAILVEHLLVSMHLWDRTYIYWPRPALQGKLLRHMQWIMADDERIKAEGGAEKLTLHELRAACHARGMYIHAWTLDELIFNLNDWIELSTYVSPPTPGEPIPHLPLPAAMDMLKPPPTPFINSAGAGANADADDATAAAYRASGLPLPLPLVRRRPPPSELVTSAPPVPDATLFDTLSIRGVPTRFDAQYTHAGNERIRLPFLASDSPIPIPESYPNPAHPPSIGKPKATHELPQPQVAAERKGTVFHLPPLPPNTRIPITLLMHAHIFKFHHQKWKFPDVIDLDGETAPPLAPDETQSEASAPTHISGTLSRPSPTPKRLQK